MKPLVLVGVLVALLGLGLAVLSFTGSGDDVATAPVAAGESTEAQADTPSALLPVAAGLALAGGAALIGIGMGNWRRPRPRGEPGDESVQPGPMRGR